MSMYIYVQVTTEVTKDELLQENETHFKISVRAEPKRGEANKSIVELLTKHYTEQGKKARVRFVHGATSGKKIFDVTYVS